MQGTAFKVIDFKGHSFGELSLLYERPRQATVYISSPTASLIVLSKRNYKKVLGASLKAKHDQAI